jgi:hypothetical protein
MPVLTEPLGRVFRRAKAQMMSDGDKLKAALADLRKLVESQQAAATRAAQIIECLGSYRQRQQAEAAKLNAALTNGSPEEIQRAFEAWAMQEFYADKAQTTLTAMIRGNVTGDGLIQWLGQHPDAKTILLRCCELRLQQAKERAASALADEQARLGPEYDAADSPVVKRQAGRVRNLEAVLKRIQSQPIEDVWLNLAGALLGYE